MSRCPGQVTDTPVVPMWLILIALGVLVLAMFLVYASEAVAHRLLESSIPLFPGSEDSDYYVDRLRRTAMGWGIILPGLVVLAGGILRMLNRERRAGVARPVQILLGSTVAVVLTASALLPRQPTGDEPAYLAMASALAVDGTLAISGSETVAHRSPASRPGEQRSVHSPGISMVFALPYRLGGIPMVRLFGVLLGLFLVWLLRGQMAGCSGDVPASAVALAVAVSFPVAVYSPLVLPEIAGAVAVAVAVIFGEVVLRSRPTLAASLAVSALPWLHVRFLLPVAFLTLWALGRTETRIRSISNLAVPLAASLAVMAIAHSIWFGSPSPFAMWHGRESLIELSQLVPGTLGILVDQQFGLLVWAPFLLFAPLGALILQRSRQDVVLAALAVAALSANPGILHSWTGGWSPAARFLVVATGPLLILSVVGFSALLKKGRLGRNAALALLAAQLALGAVCLLIPGKVYGTFEAPPRNYFLDIVGRLAGRDVATAVPSLVAEAGLAPILQAGLLVVFWLAASVGVFRRLLSRSE